MENVMDEKLEAMVNVVDWEFENEYLIVNMEKLTMKHKVAELNYSMLLLYLHVELMFDENNDDYAHEELNLLEVCTIRSIHLLIMNRVSLCVKVDDFENFLDVVKQLSMNHLSLHNHFRNMSNW